jgi:coenzyme F420-reducing hydrogenase alpha subunit
VKGSDQPRRSANKKAIAKKAVKASALASEIVTRIGRQINNRWPNLGGQLTSLLRVSREKIDDLYSSAAQAMSEQKEAFDDRRAARKAQAQIEIRTTPPTAPSRRVAKARTANGSPRPRRTPSSSKSSSSKSRS